MVRLTSLKLKIEQMKISDKFLRKTIRKSTENKIRTQRQINDTIIIIYHT